MEIRPDMVVSLSQVDDAFHFRGTGPDGQSVEVDVSEDGVPGAGVSPLQLLPLALGACSGVDVVSILKKGRQPLDGLQIEVSAERDGGKPISRITAMHVHFDISGDVAPAKAERAVRLSLSTYCTVAALLSATVRISASFGLGTDRFDVEDVMVSQDASQA